MNEKKQLIRNSTADTVERRESMRRYNQCRRSGYGGRAWGVRENGNGV